MIMRKLFLTTCLLSFCVLSVIAYDFNSAGFYYNYVSGDSSAVELVSGDIKYSENIVIPTTTDYDGKSYRVIGIGLYAFNECTKLKSITIPNTINYILDYAFKGCDELEEVVIADGTTRLTTWFNDANWYKGTFSDSPLKKVYLGRNLYSKHYMYEAAPFKDSKTLVDIVISDYVTELNIGAFKGCSSLEEIHLPESIEVINEDAFSGCSSLKSVYIPGSVRALGWYFPNIAPDLTVTDHKNVFSYCPALEEITVSEDNKVYVSPIGSNCIIIKANNQLLTGCKNTIIPQTVTSIAGAFTGCTSLTEISIPPSVKTLESMAFYDTSLKYVDIPASVKSIGMYTFDTSIGMLIDSIAVHWERADEVNCEYRAFGGDVYARENRSTMLRIPEDSYPFYANSMPWNNFGIIAEGEKYHLLKGHRFVSDGIEYQLIDNDGHLTVCRKDSYRGNVSIPSSLNYKNNTLTVTQLDDWAFAMSPSLVSMHLPRTISVIPSNAFYSCTLLEQVTFEEGSLLTEIRGDAFKSCKALKRFDMPVSIKTILNGAFTSCSALERIDFPEGLTSLGGMFGAFDGCSSLKEIVLPNSLTHLSDFCFSSCSSVTNVTLPAQIGSIGQYTFSIMSKLKSFTVLSETPPTINANAFAATPIDKATLYVPLGCKSAYSASQWNKFMKIIEINGIGYRFTQDGITYEIVDPADMVVHVCEGEYTGDVVLPTIVSNQNGSYVVAGMMPEAFTNCTGLKSVTLSDFIDIIPENAFSGCTSLETVNLKTVVREIQAKAFYGCKSLLSLSLPLNLLHVGESAFSGCSQLAKITCNAVIPPACGENAFFGINKYLCTLYVPSECIQSYKEADGWKAFSVIKPVEEGEADIHFVTIADKYFDVYNLEGQKIRSRITATDELPKGIYIINGGKVVVK